ncbi:MAG: guanylate kinase [bacterium]|nr:guanylate kinase [bacterium]
MALSKPGKIVIISSPSGGGKTSICRKLLSPVRRRQGWTFSISYTTRDRRRGERNGREYHFVDDRKFDELRKRDFFAEHFKVHLYKYGTPRGPLEKVRRQGGVMILDVDAKGARKLHREYPEAISIFILPPSVKALKQRLRQRGTETREQLAVRFKNAIQEMRSFGAFDYVVINKELKVAVRQVLDIIAADGLRVDKVDPEQIRRITG